jgi:hypothetical protein
MQNGAGFVQWLMAQLGVSLSNQVLRDYTDEHTTVSEF